MSVTHESLITGERRLTDPIIQAAIRNVEANIAAFSASEVVQLVLFPDSLAHWAESTNRSVGQVTNMLRRHRPYVAMRQALADYLGVPVSVLNSLIDAPRAEPSSRRPPKVRQSYNPEVTAHATSAETRDGTNPLEQVALEKMRREAPAMPPSRIVGYAIYPESLSAWSHRIKRFPLAYLLAYLGNVHRSAAIELALARRLNVSTATLDHFVRGRKRGVSVSLPAPGVATPLAEDE